MLSHLILAWLLLEALGPWCSHDWVVAVTRYLGSLLCSTKCIWYWVVCPVTTPNLWVFSPAPLRGEGQPVTTTLRPDRLGLCPVSRLHSSSLLTVSDIYSLSQASQCPPLTLWFRLWTEYCHWVTLTAESDKGWVQLTGRDTR